MKHDKEKSISLTIENWSSSESESDESSDEENSSNTNKEDSTTANSVDAQSSIANNTKSQNDNQTSEKTVNAIEVEAASATDIDVQTTLSTDEYVWSDEEQDAEESLVDETKTELADNSFFTAKSCSTTSLPNLSRSNSSNFTESQCSPREKIESATKDDAKSLMRRERLQPIGQKVRDLKHMKDPKEQQGTSQPLSISGKTFFTQKPKENSKEEPTKKVKIVKGPKKARAHQKSKTKEKNQRGSEKYIDKRSLSIITRPGKK